MQKQASTRKIEAYNGADGAPLGMMVALCTGCAPSVNSATRAWPPSWYAVSLRFLSEMTADLRSAPMMIRSLACSRSAMPTASLPSRAAFRAATLTRFARSAPLKPGVPRAMTCPAKQRDWYMINPSY